MDAKILDCGHQRAVTDGIGAGYATDANTGKTMCYPCADSRQAAEMSAAPEKFVAYVDCDGKNITTWSGGVLARVTYHTTSRTGWYRSQIHYWGARDADGRYWYGRNGGPGMVIQLRRYKEKVAS